MFKDLRSFATYLRDKDDLLVIGDELSTKYEVGAAIKRLARSTQKALWFERVTGYDVPIIANVMGTRQRLAASLGTSGDPTETYFERRENLIKPSVGKTGPVNAVVIRENADILKTLPVLTHHEGDSNPYFTSALIVAHDPDSGARGFGIHRVEIKSGRRIGLLLSSPPLSDFLAKADERNVPLDIAVVLGPDPITFFVGCTRAPQGVDKWDIAGALAQQPIELVECQSHGVQVPAEAQFVVEGRVLPRHREKEGPFGESTGYYLTFNSPVAEIDVITHRKDPIYQALMPFALEDEVLMGVTWEGEVLRALKSVLPCVTKIHLRDVGLTAVVQIRKEQDSQVKEVFRRLLEIVPKTKIYVVIDDDVDPHNMDEVHWALSSRFDPERDTVLETGRLGLPIDPSAHQGLSNSKLCLDATRPVESGAFRKVEVPEAATSRAREIAEKLAGQRAGMG